MHTVYFDSIHASPSTPPPTSPSPLFRFHPLELHVLTFLKAKDVVEAWNGQYSICT